MSLALVSDWDLEWWNQERKDERMDGWMEYDAAFILKITPCSNVAKFIFIILLLSLLCFADLSHTDGAGHGTVL